MILNFGRMHLHWFTPQSFALFVDVIDRLTLALRAFPDPLGHIHHRRGMNDRNPIMINAIIILPNMITFIAAALLGDTVSRAVSLLAFLIY